MKKLNKTQLLAKAELNITTLLNTTDLVAKSKKDDLIAALLESIAFIGPTSAMSTKVNNEGDVWCNYFEMYMPVEKFGTKLNSKKYNKLVDGGMTAAEATVEATGYKANCVEGDQIIRKTKSMRKRLEQQAMVEFRFGRLDNAELNTLLDIAEDITTEKYDSIDNIPTIWDRIQPNMGDDTANMLDPSV